MAVSLQKGQKISLTKDNPGLQAVAVGLGWDQAEQKRGLFGAKQSPIDCDAAALVLTDGRIAVNSDVVYFGNLRNASSTIQHLGDNLTGAGDGDDEQVLVNLAGIPSGNDKIVFVVNIYQAVQRKQHFGMIRNAFIRIVDTKTNIELCRYNLSDDYTNMTAMIFGEIYKDKDEWKFNAVGQGTTDPGLKELVVKYS